MMQHKVTTDFQYDKNFMSVKGKKSKHSKTKYVGIDCIDLSFIENFP